ncbi:uncharacterized protein LOC129860810 [Salvelinus fontinalis]|uniref:uncharacterized protein LOC129860810 n=1 Tax=Salvelinus fontinalis TaxID=8038 RepID=UPI0024853C7C|nr:uncharacterized protein LOC129860810 [Salvelinus fontinalis]
MAGPLNARRGPWKNIFPQGCNTFCLMWTISGHCSGGREWDSRDGLCQPGLTKCGGTTFHHHLQLSRDGKVLCPSSAALDAQEALAGELIGLEYLFDQTGLLLQDYKAAIEELETGDPDVQGENDEGFVELVEFQGLTVPVLETALLVGTFHPTPTPSTSIQSTAASVSPLSSTPVRATPPPGPLSSTLVLVSPLSYVPVRANITP